MLPPVRLPRTRKRRPDLPSPERPGYTSNDDGEILTGVVLGKDAKVTEERSYKSLVKLKAVSSIEFRRAVNAPRGMPGWKELDLLAGAYGMYYAFEIDTEFTHQGKERKDVLHDAIVLKALQQEGFNMYPKVIHVQGDADLVDQAKSDRFFKEFFQ